LVQKHRSAIEGIVFGFLLGPVGIIVAALMPTLPAAEAADDQTAEDASAIPWLKQAEKRARSE
jgi:hypothetical protein